MSAQKSKLDTIGFQQLHTTYRNRLQASVARWTRNPKDAEDITAAAFANAWSQRANFRGEASPYTWLTAIARNEACNRFRRSQYSRMQSLDERLADVVAEPGGTAQDLERAELHAQLIQAPIAERSAQRIFRAADQILRAGHATDVPSMEQTQQTLGSRTTVLTVREHVMRCPAKSIRYAAISGSGTHACHARLGSIDVQTPALKAAIWLFITNILPVAFCGTTESESSTQVEMLK